MSDIMFNTCCAVRFFSGHSELLSRARIRTNLVPGGYEGRPWRVDVSVGVLVFVSAVPSWKNEYAATDATAIARMMIATACLPVAFRLLSEVVSKGAPSSSAGPLCRALIPGCMRERAGQQMPSLPSPQ